MIEPGCGQRASIICITVADQTNNEGKFVHKGFVIGSRRMFACAYVLSSLARTPRIHSQSRTHTLSIAHSHTHAVRVGWVGRVGAKEGARMRLHHLVAAPACEHHVTVCEHLRVEKIVNHAGHSAAIEATKSEADWARAMYIGYHDVCIIMMLLLPPACWMCCACVVCYISCGCVLYIRNSSFFGAVFLLLSKMRRGR